MMPSLPYETKPLHCLAKRCDLQISRATRILRKEIARVPLNKRGHSAVAAFVPGLLMELMMEKAVSIPPGRARWPNLEDDAIRIVRRFSPGEERCGDLYLCYGDAPRARVRGILVTERGDINAVIAYCPLSPEAPLTAKLPGRALARQFRIASRIAERPSLADDAVDAIGLRSAGTNGRPMPHWVYGLSCVPVSRPWDGMFMHPRPFCPVLFEAMASQSKAKQWLQWQMPPHQS
jgi:hypothetical protein